MHETLVQLSRLQFALTIAFHYLYPPLSIGLGRLPGLRGSDLPEDARPALAPGGAVLDARVRADVLDRRRHGPGDGVRVRHELGRLLALRRRRLRQRARRRRHLRVLPRVGLPRAAALRLGRAAAAHAFLQHADGGARRALQRDLDRRRELLDADAGRLPHRPGTERPARRDHRLLGPRVQPLVGDAPRARRARRVDGRRVPRDERRRVVPAEGSPPAIRARLGARRRGHRARRQRAAGRRRTRERAVRREISAGEIRGDGRPLRDRARGHHANGLGGRVERHGARAGTRRRGQLPAARRPRRSPCPG